MDIAAVLATYAFHTSFKQSRYVVSKILVIACSLFILLTVKNLDPKTRMFVIVVLFWNVIDALDTAIGEPKKNEDLVHKYARSESDTPGLDAGMGRTAPEVSRECEKTSGNEPELVAQDMGRESAQESV